MTGGYQKFYEKRDGVSSRSEFEKPIPYDLSLGMDQHGKPLLPFRYSGISGAKILVTKSYDDMFHRILGLRNDIRERGVVLTGQPGTGGSL